MAVGEGRYLVFLLLMAGFWTSFNQIFMNLPEYIRDYADTSDLIGSLTPIASGVATAAESIGFDTTDPAILETAESESIRYVYYPSTRSVELVLQSGAIMLHWNEGLGCLEGDVQQDDFLSIWTRAAAPSPGS